MATYNVSTWEQLVEALQADVDSNVTDTITLTADIDCNYSIPLGVQSTIYIGHPAYQSEYGTKVIDGQGHVIRNLRTHIVSPVPIFRYEYDSYAKAKAIWKNIDFINLCLDDYLFSWRMNYNNNNGYMHMYN